MTSRDEERKKMKEYFEEKITFNKEQFEIMFAKYKKFKVGAVDAKTFSAFTCIAFSELYEAFYMLRGAYEGLIDLDNDMTVKIDKLEKLAREIGEQSGADMAKIVKELTNVKKTLKEPMYERLDRFITKLKEEAEERDKAGKMYIK